MVHRTDQCFIECVVICPAAICADRRKIISIFPGHNVKLRSLEKDFADREQDLMRIVLHECLLQDWQWDQHGAFVPLEEWEWKRALRFTYLGF